MGAVGERGNESRVVKDDVLLFAAPVWSDGVTESPEGRDPKIFEVRSGLPASRRRSRAIAELAILALNLVIWAGLFAAALTSDALWLKLLFGALVGVATGTTFVIGHDASHGSLTPYRTLNRFCARLAFLPSWHVNTLWDIGHNKLHHGWTNLRVPDYAYAPPTVEEFAHWPWHKRVMRRIYHTIPGLSFFYLLEVWWPHIVLSTSLEKPHIKSFATLNFERTLIFAFVGLQVWLAAQFGVWGAKGGWMLAAEIAISILWPFYVWNWVMTFVTLQHHTHPRVRWYDNEKEWSFYRSQVCGTVHMKFPRIIELLFANIFEHTAHHVDKAIPLMNLPVVQRDLEASYSRDIVVEQGSLRHLRMILRECQLYDYQEKKWLRFP